jgi:hypothetical protein
MLESDTAEDGRDCDDLPPSVDGSSLPEKEDASGCDLLLGDADLANEA